MPVNCVLVAYKYPHYGMIQPIQVEKSTFHVCVKNLTRFALISQLEPSTLHRTVGYKLEVQCGTRECNVGRNLCTTVGTNQCGIGSVTVPDLLEKA